MPRRHSCLLPFIQQLHSPARSWNENEQWHCHIKTHIIVQHWNQGEAPRAGVHFVTSQGRTAFGLHQGFRAHAGRTHITNGNFALCCCTRCFPCQQAHEKQPASTNSVSRVEKTVISSLYRDIQVAVSLFVVTTVVRQNRKWLILVWDQVPALGVLLTSPSSEGRWTQKRCCCLQSAHTKSIDA